MSLLTNLVSYWKFDESSGNAADAHGSNTLTNNGTATFAAGKINNACDLESSGAAQFFSIADASQSGLDLSTELSFSLWTKLESAPGTQYQFINKHSQPNNECYFFGYRTASTPNLRLLVDKTGNGTVSDVLGINTTLNNAQWYHLVVTWTGSNKTAKFYIDGTQSGSDQVGTNVDTIFNSAAAFGIGTSLVEDFDGMIDEVGVWSRALTSTEVSQLYNSGNGLAYPLTTTSIKSINGLASASVKTVRGLAIANVKTWNGLA